MDGDKITISIIHYSDEDFVEKHNISLEECLKSFDTTKGVTWIHVNGVSNPTKIVEIGKHFKLHTLVLEDILNTTQRSKLDTYQDQVFIIARYLQYDEVHCTLRDDQVSLVFGEHFLISFFENSENIFQPVQEHLRQSTHRIRSLGTDFLAYTLLDILVDSYFVILEKVDVYLESLDEKLMNASNLHIVKNIQHAKLDMVTLRKAIWPMREVINRFQHVENVSIHPTTQIYLHDIYDHIIQIIDVIEGFRDIVSGLMDIYLSNINMRTNDIIKFLTIVSTIFVPLTFIASIYGMNFEHMPELHIVWFYPFVLFLMVAVAGAMLYYFWKKKWI